MANVRGGTDTFCPYYVREANKSITCEGMIAGTYSQQRFDSEADLHDFQAQNCSTQSYDRCPLAAALIEKYRNDGNSVILDGNNVIVFSAGTTIGTRISIARRRAGFTQKQLSCAAHVSRSHIGDIEAGRHNPSIYTLKAIGAALKIDAHQFIAEDMKREK
ncbi:MAG: helix-turn-helix transcriptional regulator [Clostridia bacterium]